MKTAIAKTTSIRLARYFMMIFFLPAFLFFTAGMPNVQAASAKTLTSHGNLIYEGRRSGACLHAADILLLEEKISTIPEQCFDPVCYSHAHHWEYRGINEKTHIRHCEDCGDSGDLTSPHRAERWERDTIYYEGKTYAGKRYTCACGYQWCMEQAHTLICEAVDGTSHQSRCALDGTPYCQGCEPIVEEHYAWYYETGGDELHHEKVCFDCGFRIEEDCRFEGADEEGRPVCICGRCRTPDESETSDVKDAPEKPEGTDAADPPDTGDAPEAPETPDPPDTGDAPEKPDTPDPPDTGDAPEEPDTPDPPDTGDAPEEPDTPNPPDTGDAPEAPDMPDPPDEEEPDAPETGTNDNTTIKGGFRPQ